MKIGGYIKIRNNKKNKFGTSEEHQRNTNNNDNNIYIYLFNKYIERIKQEPKRAVQIISEMKDSFDYELLNLEQQNQIFLDLMNPENRR